MNKSSVSVVIPTFNRGQLVVRAVESVLNQTYLPDAVIVVDDCSTDNTVELLQPYVESGKIQLIALTQNGERGAARNLGARSAKTTHIAFLDADDFWVKHKLERQLHVMGDRNIALVNGTRVVDDRGDDVAFRHMPVADHYQLIPFANPYFGGVSSVLMRLDEFWRAGGFPEQREVQASEDWVFFARLYMAGIPIEVIHEDLTCYGLHGANSTGNPDVPARSRINAISLLEREGLFVGDQLRRAHCENAVAVSQGYLQAKRWKEARGWAAKAAKYAKPAELPSVMGRIFTSASWSVLHQPTSNSRPWLIRCVYCGARTMKIDTQHELAHCAKCGRSRSTEGLI